MRKILLSSIILLMFSCKSTYIERGKSSWHVQTNTQDEKKTRSEKHPQGHPEIIQNDFNSEELTVYITESNKLRPNIKTDITFLKSKAKELIDAVVKAEKPRAPTITVIQKVRSKGFVKVESRNTGHKVAMYLALAALCSIIFGVVYAIYFADEWDFTPFIFIALGLLLLALALFAYLISGGRLRFRLGFLGL